MMGNERVLLGLFRMRFKQPRVEVHRIFIDYRDLETKGELTWNLSKQEPLRFGG
jgi:hypothetical protein